MSDRLRVDTVADSIADPDPLGEVVLHDGGHLFESERCVYCNVNVYDITAHGAPPVCPVPREPLVYSTVTP